MSARRTSRAHAVAPRTSGDPQRPPLGRHVHGRPCDHTSPSPSATDLPLTTILRTAIDDAQPLSLVFVYEEALVDAREGTPVHPAPELLAGDPPGHSPGRITSTLSARRITPPLGRWFEFVPVTLWAEHGSLAPRPDDRRWRRTQSLDAGWTAHLRQFLESIHRPDAGLLRRRAPDRVRVALRSDDPGGRGTRRGNSSRCSRKPAMQWASRCS